jgi:hypothetical protein
MRSRLEVWANWAFDNWLLLFLPPFSVVLFLLFLYGSYTADPDLTERSRRTKIFWELKAEMDGLAVPARSAINKSQANHKQGSILISTRYRTDASREQFFREMDDNLRALGWIAYTGNAESHALRTFNYCRGKQDATLYLESKAFFDSTPGEYWKLYFTVGLGSHPAGCPDAQ